MKVQCGQCPAKYAVSDERVVDKKVRIHCKRCGAAIVVDGKVDPPLVTSTPARKSARPPSSAPESPPPIEKAPDSRPSPRAVAHTIMGGLEAPIAERLRSRSQPPPRPMRSPASAPTPGEDEPRTGMPPNHRGLTDPPPGTDESRWRVALTKQDLRWMTTNEVVEAYRAGAVKLETFVFRTGMPTWVTLLEVPEIAEALSAAGNETQASPSSLPPPRSPSSLPPPRRPAPRNETAEALEALAEFDASEPMPFALVAERANGANASAADVSDAPSAPPLPPPRAVEPPPRAVEPPPRAVEPPPRAVEPPPRVVERPPEPPAVAPAAPTLVTSLHPSGPAPFAAAREASGGGRWVWVAVVLLLLGAVAALIAPRYGIKLL